MITPDAVGVVRQPADQFAVLLYAREIATVGGKVPACWSSLEHRVKAGYQVSLPVSSYFLLEGELPQAEVEDCVRSATNRLVTPAHEGDLVAFSTPSGTVYAAWRGAYVVLGNRDQVTAAVRVHDPAVVAGWRAHVAEPGAAPVWMLRTDASFADLLGAPTTSYQLVIDKLEGPPRSELAGRFVVTYASAPDAETGERYMRDWIGRGRFPRKIAGPADAVALYDQLATALQRARMTRKGNVLELAFDTSTFGGMWPQFAAAAASLGAGR